MAFQGSSVYDGPPAARHRVSPRRVPFPFPIPFHVPLARPRRRDPAPLGCSPGSAAADAAVDAGDADAVADADADADFEVFRAPARVQKASARLRAPKRHLSPAEAEAVEAAAVV